MRQIRFHREVTGLARRKLNLTNDLVFKYIFGHEERKFITLEFINDMTERTGSDAFKDLVFRNVELSPQKQTEKLGRLDIFAQMNDGTRTNIEMQVFNYLFMEKRSLFYWAQMYLHFDPLQAGQGYNELKNAIAINILRHATLPQEDIHAMYGLYNPKNMHRLTDDLELHFLELEKVKKKSIREMSRVERWCAILLDNLSDEEKEELAMENLAYRGVFEAADQFAQTDKDYQAYLARESAILDYNTNFVAGQKLAREQGMQDGRKEGMQEGTKHGEERLANLLQQLQKAGRMQDASAAITDPKRREELYQEFSIS